VEKRKSTRYHLRLPVLFTWSDPSGAMQKEGGFTLDISMRGLRVISHLCAPAGADIAVEILIYFERTSRSAILTGTLGVVRVQQEYGYWNFARRRRIWSVWRGQI
jgi:hypothetical protein